MHRGQRKHKSLPGSKEGFLEEVMVKASNRVLEEHGSGKPHAKVPGVCDGYTTVK